MNQWINPLLGVMVWIGSILQKGSYVRGFVMSWWYFLGKFWRLREVGPCWRKWVTDSESLEVSSSLCLCLSASLSVSLSLSPSLSLSHTHIHSLCPNPAVFPFVAPITSKPMWSIDWCIVCLFLLPFRFHKCVRLWFVHHCTVSAQNISATQGWMTKGTNEWMNEWVNA